MSQQNDWAEKAARAAATGHIEARAAAIRTALEGYVVVKAELIGQGRELAYGVLNNADMLQDARTLYLIDIARQIAAATATPDAEERP